MCGSTNKCTSHRKQELSSLAVIKQNCRKKTKHKSK